LVGRTGEGQLKKQAAIERLDRDIQQLKIDFERFFNGSLPTPPEELRHVVRQQIGRLRAEPMQALADRFRLNTLEARFNALNELFNRRLREHEEGAAAPPARPLPTTPQRYDPYQGIVVGEAPPPEAIQTLYRELYDDDTPSAQSNFEKFHTYLLGQMAGIRERSGCDEVKFRIATEDGEVKLKAKPVRHTRLSVRGGSDSG
jgi:hypothetical protein